jgi:hypothetical protein
MSVQSPAERQSVVCHHVWVDPEDPSRSHLNVQLRIGLGDGDMRPGYTYVCQDCGCRVYIKHRGILHSTVPREIRFSSCRNGYIIPSLFATYCVCGVRYPEVNYYRGPTGKEYALSRMRAHITQCNQHRVSHERYINFHSS